VNQKFERIEKHLYKRQYQTASGIRGRDLFARGRNFFF
jgi:hypothetical protein